MDQEEKKAETCPWCKNKSVYVCTESFFSKSNIGEENLNRMKCATCGMSGPGSGDKDWARRKWHDMIESCAIFVVEERKRNREEIELKELEKK